MCNLLHSNYPPRKLLKQSSRTLVKIPVCMFRWLGKGIYTKRLKHSLFFFSLLFNLLFLIFLFFFCLFTISYFTNMVFIMYVTKKKRRKMWNRRTREMKRKASDFVNKIRRTGDTIWSNYKEHLLF